MCQCLASICGKVLVNMMCATNMIVTGIGYCIYQSLHGQRAGIYQNVGHVFSMVTDVSKYPQKFFMKRATWTVFKGGFVTYFCLTFRLEDNQFCLPWLNMNIFAFIHHPYQPNKLHKLGYHWLKETIFSECKRYLLS